MNHKDFRRSAIRRWMATVLLLLVTACRPQQFQPVAIYPEDICSSCRMAISDERCASELIDDDGVAYKFDDIGCLENFGRTNAHLHIAAAYLKDYETKQWVPRAQARIIETGIATPMGSGKIAFADSGRAKAFQSAHPPGS